MKFFRQFLTPARYCWRAALFTFAVATCIGWSYYAQKAVEYVFGVKAVVPYKALYIVLIFMGSVFSINIVWSFSDIANAMMAIPNLLSLVLLAVQPYPRHVNISGAESFLKTKTSAEKSNSENRK